ncbi:MAG: molybdenum cofactor guanylyltransferase [Acutalibacter sp.]|jgi:molybdopterin-guanine dinucleotide biosynthesis protein A
MIPFESKRNQVYPVLWRGKAAVEKHFLQQEDWKRETAQFRGLSGKLPIPQMLEERPGVLVTEFCPHPTLLQILEEQEDSGFSPAPWIALADWLRRCHRVCGQLPVEGNLRNFLWEKQSAQVIGLDLESLQPSTLADSGAQLIAGLLTYAPGNTPLKRQAANLLAAQLNVPEEQVHQAETCLLHRRESRKQSVISGILLAGGKSTRMGRDKGGLKLFGKTFLQCQVEKLQALGVGEVLISGGEIPPLPGTVTVPDLYPNRGPLGGIHACLLAARYPTSLVLTVDTPLVPAAALAHLRRAHREGVTVLYHRGKEEPLISVMDRWVANTIEPLIAHSGAPVRALKGRVPWRRWEYLGPERYLDNCNTPQEYEALLALAKSWELFCGIS